MVETLLTPSSIKLFGRVMTGIAIDPSTLGQSGYLGANTFLRDQLTVGASSISTTGTATNGNVNLPINLELDIAALLAKLTSNTSQIPVSDTTGGTVIPANTTCYVSVANGNNVALTLSNPATVTGKKPVLIQVVLLYSFPPTLARIYAFSFEGGFTQLSRPALFLVHGPGIPVGNWDSPSSMDQAGVAGREWDFSGNQYFSDLAYWEYEKGDFSFRLDLEAGPFEQILLQAALRGMGVSGAGVSGAGVSGAGVSGAGVSGAGVSGAGVSGAGVSGAGVRR